jgi:preprotein translocase subunit SecE
MFDTINKDHIPLMVNDKGELNPSGKQMLKKIVDDFQNAKDKINDIHADVREIQIDMKNNIKNIVANVDDAKKLQQTSDNIRVGADTYKKNAGELKRVTWWQNCKLTIIIISVVVVIALVIIIPLVVKS